jgi:hypothetical protein
MSRSKRLFLFFALIFVLLLIYASFDIATRTTFPGSKPQLRERIEREIIMKDSVLRDSVKLPEKK